MRPSPGRVPVWPAKLGWFTLSVQGPMARTVEDLALYCSAIAGPDARAPIAIEEPPSIFAQPLRRDFKGVRIAWSRDLGYLPVDPVITQVCDAQRGVFEQLGCQVEDAHPDLQGASDVFKILRAWRFALERGEELKKYRHLMKDTVIWNIERGLELTGRQIAEAEAKRTSLYQRVMTYLTRYDFLILPVSQVPPFPVEIDWVHEVNGQQMETYIDWMATCYAITCTGLPAISVPAGFTPDGLPIGLQIVGRHHRDFEVLQLAHAFEGVSGFGRQRPEIVLGR